ncbi:unnamed protein product [Albugo candida]|uniref:PCI domain-containing protein n=1 Tax=Albugo candida TaxID=65357 RepID=A0A024GTA8_9STRA|nr:unnamed protein product [Albugo candida]|eukprot:CCI50016.1 unnamed protein product [Albugo candida]
MLLAAYLDRIGHAIVSKSGHEVAAFISLASVHVQVELESLSLEQIDQICRSKLARLETFGDIICNIVKARKHLTNQQTIEAYECEIAALVKLMGIFREESNWVLSFLHVLILDTRLIASSADQQAARKAGEEIHDNLRNAEQHLKKMFAMAANDRAPLEQSKKLGSLHIVDQLFKIYFKLNTIHLCRNLIRAVEGPAFPAFERFSRADKVTYQYYVGRISMFEDQYHKAEKCLDYAWEHCHKSHVRNKRMILQFLVPVKLLLGIMPSPQLMSSYALDEYNGLTEAIRCGDLRSFNTYLERYQDKYIQQGVFLLIEKLRLVVFRNLLKKVYLIRQSHQLRFSDLQLACSFVTDEAMDMNELECILANLIFKGYIKGYMSHQKKILVVSKAQPFPPITTVSN